jgi:hypothetical protein
MFACPRHPQHETHRLHTAASTIGSAATGVVGRVSSAAGLGEHQQLTQLNPGLTVRD